MKTQKGNYKAVREVEGGNMREVELWIEQLPRGGADGGAAKKTYSRRNCLKKKRAKRTARIVGRATEESQVVSRGKNRRKSEFCTRGKQHQTNGLRLFEIRTLTLLRVDTDRIFLDVTARSCRKVHQLVCLPLAHQEVVPLVH